MIFNYYSFFKTCFSIFDLFIYRSAMQGVIKRFLIVVSSYQSLLTEYPAMADEKNHTACYSPLHLKDLPNITPFIFITR